MSDEVGGGRRSAEREAGAYTIGIDVGTTYTAAAICRGGRAEVATLGDRGDVIPSVAYLREDGVLLVGHAAERRAVEDPTRVARGFKRRIGDDVPLQLGDRAHTPEALTAAIVRWTVDLVTAREGGPPSRTVLTFPASWGRHRRALLLGAAEAAGVPDAELVPEPVAAAIHYSGRHELAVGAAVGIYDLGGGTFDATIVRRVGEGFEIVGQPQGEDNLGGVDFDAAVWDHVAGVVGTDTLAPGDDLPARHLRALAQVRAAVVDAKEALSYDTQAIVPVTLPGVMTEVRLTRAEFEEMARPALVRTLDVFARTCRTAGVDPADLDTVLLAGGSSRIPMIAQLMGSELGAQVTSDAHPKLATCLGAAWAAALGLQPPSHLDPATPAEGAIPVAPPTAAAGVVAAGAAPLATPAPDEPTTAPTPIPDEPGDEPTTVPEPIVDEPTTTPTPIPDELTIVAAPIVGDDATPPQGYEVPAVTEALASPVGGPGDDDMATRVLPVAPVARGPAPPAHAPPRRRRRRAVALGLLGLAVAAAVVAALVFLPDSPEETDTADGDGTTSSTTSSTTTTTAPSTTASTTGTTGTTAATPTSEQVTTTPTVEAVSSTTSSSGTTVPPPPGPGDPCDPAGGDPDCIDVDGTGNYRIVEGYADCIATSPAPEMCEDLDGDGYAGYPDSG